MGLKLASVRLNTIHSPTEAAVPLGSSQPPDFRCQRKCDSDSSKQVNGLLVRVGIDQTDGGWNAPVRTRSGEFAYVTITDTKPLRDGYARYYDEFAPAIWQFGFVLPEPLRGKPTHLDPDFEQLTYGDQGQRAKRINSVVRPGDLLAFFSSFQAVDGPTRPLIYALIGLYVIDEITPAKNVAQQRWHENAHTRRIPGETDIVVRARPGVSGRLSRCIPIGELRDGVYRVRKDLIEEWGDLDIKDGYIHRSVRLPAFRNAERFYRWFLAHDVTLLPQNNPR